jgi:hypothetical protein
MTDPVSQRRHLRRRVVEPAQLHVVGQGCVFSCMIRDISEGGARLRIPSDLPWQGELILVAARVGLNQRVHVVWRDEHSAGVAFGSKNLQKT